MKAPNTLQTTARKCAKPRHLSASSPSGNVRGECRGWSPLDRGRNTSREMTETTLKLNLYFLFFVRPEFPQNKKRSKWKNK